LLATAEKLSFLFCCTLAAVRNSNPSLEPSVTLQGISRYFDDK